MLDKVVITDDADILALIFALDKHAFLVPVNLCSRDSGAQGCIHLETLGRFKQTRAASQWGGNGHRLAVLSAWFRERANGKI